MNTRSLGRFAVLASLSTALCFPGARAHGEDDKTSLGQQIQAIRDAAAKNVAPAVGAKPGADSGATQSESVDATTAGVLSMKAASGSVGRSFRAVGELSNLESYVQSSQYEQAIRLARQSVRQADSPEMKKLWSDLLANLQKEQTAADQELSTQAEALFKKIAETAQNASSPSDLAPLLDEISDLTDGGLSNTNSLTSRRLRNQLNYAQNFIEYWSQYLEAKATGREADELRALENVRSSGSQYRFILRYMPAGALEDRRTALRKVTAERARKSLAVMTDMVSKATSAADYRKALDYMEENRALFSDSDTVGQEVYSQADQARSSIRSWLAVLDADAGGDATATGNALANFLSNSYSNRGYVGAKAINDIRARVAQSILDAKAATAPKDPVEAEITAQLDKVNSAADVAALEVAVTTMRNSLYRNDSQPIYALSNDLQNLRQAWTALEQGRYRSVWDRNQTTYGNGTTDPWLVKIDALRNGLIGKAVAAQWKLPESSEPADVLIKGAIADAMGKADWARVMELLQAERVIARPYGAYNTMWESPLEAEIGGVRDYLSGQNLEAAAQYVEAARAYQHVIARVGERLPRKEATARLAALTKEHPEIAAGLNH